MLNYMEILRRGLLSCETRYNLVAFDRVISTLETAKGTTTAVRYFISSSTLTVESFVGAVRGHHWSIENNLHWGMDMAFRGHESRARVKNLAANLAILKHISFNTLKKLDIKPSIRVRRKLAGWDNNFMLDVLKAQGTT